MSTSINIESLRVAVGQGHIEWQRHSLERMVEREISREAVIQTILQGERIEDYPGDRPLASALFFGLTGIRPIHAVIAFNPELQKAFVITVYVPDLDHFEPDFKTRRKP